MTNNSASLPFTEKEIENASLASSFRDPAGFLFQKDKRLFRAIAEGFQSDYGILMSSGLYAKLASQGLLIPHKERGHSESGRWKIIEPERLPFISYPYEWCFMQYKEAALATLKIQKLALAHGLSLKDASAFNLQFKNNQPILIDTLSFEKYHDGQPWVAYRQFCRHFLAPLALMAKTDWRLGLFLRQDVDGMPLDLASKLLPKSTYASIPLLLHIHLHARFQNRYAKNQNNAKIKTGRMEKDALLLLLGNLENAVLSLSPKPQKTQWDGYYQETNYSSSAKQEKTDLIDRWLGRIKPVSVLDLGANDGSFSRLASQKNIFTLSSDSDPNTVNRNFLRAKKKNDRFLHPLMFDLLNPSPALGWANRERQSLVERGPFGLIMALALLHHLSITHNISFKAAAEYFACLGRFLILEFVPLADSNADFLAKAKDVWPDHYSVENFETAFLRHYRILEKVAIKGSERILYLFERI